MRTSSHGWMLVRIKLSHTLLVLTFPNPFGFCFCSFQFWPELRKLTKKNVFLFQVVVCIERMVMTHELIAAKVAKGDFDFTMTFIIEGSIPYEL